MWCYCLGSVKQRTRKSWERFRKELQRSWKPAMKLELALTVGKAGRYHLRRPTTAGTAWSALPVPWACKEKAGHVAQPWVCKEKARHVAQPWACQEVHLSCPADPASTAFPSSPLPWTKMSTSDIPAGRKSSALPAVPGCLVKHWSDLGLFILSKKMCPGKGF